MTKKLVIKKLKRYNIDVMKRSPILKSKISNLDSSRHAFTLVELLVSVGIFTMMTALVVVKYGNFNQSVLLTNLAYDVALTIRTAQTYGLSVKVSDPNAQTLDFQSGYGVHFDTRSGVADVDTVLGVKKNQAIVFFVDSNSNGIFDNESERISTYAIKRGATVSGLCVSVTSTCTIPGSGISATTIDIIFKRPEPNAIIHQNGTDCGANIPCSYTEITVKGTDQGTRTISIRANGQISVKD